MNISQDDKKYNTKYFEAVFVKKWNLSIINHLLSGPRRFNELYSSLNISGRTLSNRLRELELEKIIVRTVYPEKPVRIEYELTSKGKAIESMIRELHLWHEQFNNEEKEYNAWDTQ